MVAGALVPGWISAVGSPNEQRVNSYRCHYCERPNGRVTRDHVRAKANGGRHGRTVKCCQLCNSLKGARDYFEFCFTFVDFLEVERDAYLAADPDDPATIGAWQRKFDSWSRMLERQA